MDAYALEFQDTVTDELMDEAAWLHDWTSAHLIPSACVASQPWKSTPTCRLMLIAAGLMRVRETWEGVSPHDR